MKKLKMSLVISPFFFVLGCQAQDVIDFLLQKPSFLGSSDFVDRLYDQQSDHPYARQLEKFFPSLYQLDKAEKNVDPCKRLIIRLLTMMEKAPRMYRGLLWCGCAQAPLPIRIRLAMRILDSVVRRFGRTDEQLIYTSHASGKLLQDFIVIAGLIELGYSNIIINIIDIEYQKRQLSPVQIMLNQHIRSIVWLKQRVMPTYTLRCSVIAYQDAYDYLEEVKSGKAPRSHIVTMVDPGDDLLRKEFKYRGPVSRISLIEYVHKNNKTRCAIYLPRNKNFKYFYATNVSQDDKVLMKSIIQNAQKNVSDKNLIEYLAMAMHENFHIRDINFFQSPHRIFDDLAHEGTLQNAIVFQLCTGVITSGVRDGLPIKHLQKVWL